MNAEPSSSPALPPPRRRFGAGALAVVATLSAVVGAGASYAVAHHHHDAGGPAAPAAAREQWQCPMHPSIVQDHPGECPICGMKLVKLEAVSPASGADGAARRILLYRSPMGTGETSPVPRKDAMGMDFLPVYADEAGGAAPAAEGLATVNIDPSRQQLIGLRTAAAARGPVGGSWRTVGRVTVDETRVHHVNVKVGGYVSHTQVDFVGKAVRQGEPLFSVYSPELLSGQEEYLLALRTRERLRANGAAGNDGDDLVAAARRKLELWDVPESELRRIEQTGVPMKELTFYAPHSGVVTKKDVVPGMRINAGEMPLELVDLTRVWVRADVYEGELRHVKLGMPASLTLKAYPNRTFKGRVAFIDPLLDPKTRTVDVRLEFGNSSGELKPEMFGEVVLQGVARQGLRIPTDAVIDSGTRSVVFVAVGEGRFQPREVALGESDGTYVEVASGVAEGGQVVTRANFLVDSESRLRASLANLGGGRVPARTATDAPSAPAAAPAAASAPAPTASPDAAAASPVNGPAGREGNRP